MEDGLKRRKKRRILQNISLNTAKRSEFLLRTEPRNEVKTRQQIVKDLKEKEKNKIKQMNKKDRESYLKKKGLWREKNQPRPSRRR